MLQVINLPHNQGGGGQREGRMEKPIARENAEEAVGGVLARSTSEKRVFLLLLLPKTHDNNWRYSQEGRCTSGGLKNGGGGTAF